MLSEEKTHFYLLKEPNLQLSPLTPFTLKTSSADEKPKNGKRKANSLK